MKVDRVNNEVEKVLIIVKYELPAIFYVVMWVIFGAITSAWITMAQVVSVVFIVGLIPSLLILLFNIAYPRYIRASTTELTNKRIRGKIKRFFRTRQFSYRLDSVDNVEYVSVLGIRTIVINFTQGHEYPVSLAECNRTVRLHYVSNAQDVYDNISILLKRCKNDKDLD